jgi:hypothetical protein
MSNSSEWGASGGPGNKPARESAPSGPGKGSSVTSMPNQSSQVSGAIREGAREVREQASNVAESAKDLASQARGEIGELRGRAKGCRR